MFESMPSVEFLRTKGKFHSYILPGHYEVWRIGKVLYVIVDGVKSGHHFQYVELHKPSEDQKYYAGFHPLDGEPCLKD